MRGEDRRSGSLFSYVDIEKRVRQDHPLRSIKTLADEALAGLHHDFAALYSRIGRPSIPPEQLPRAMLLQAFDSIRSERQLMERMEFDLLFRWSYPELVEGRRSRGRRCRVGRDELHQEPRPASGGDVARAFLAAVLSIPRVKRLLSSDHFSVDGTLIEAWASMKSFTPKDGSGDVPPPGDPPSGGGRNAEVDLHGEKRGNATHASTTDPDARLYRKGCGREAKLRYLGHALMENRDGLIVDARVTRVDGRAERVADRPNEITVGADKAFDTRDFVHEARAMNVTPHVTRNASGRRSAIDGRVTRHPGYAASLRIRKRIEEAFGWGKEVGRMRRTRFQGLPRVGLSFAFTAAAYNLVRLPKLLPAT